MNIPLVLDIAIGLIFIYLILSLLASEIQELIATLLQWRAKHLKKSIEVLLVGGESSEDEFSKVRHLTNALYQDPLINSLNQEGRGPIVSLLRTLTQLIGRPYLTLYKRTTKKESIFGRNSSAPSYIQPKAFSSTILETLKIPDLVQKSVNMKLNNFKELTLESVKGIQDKLVNDPRITSVDDKNNIEQEYVQLQQRFEKIVDDFRNYRANLSISIDRMGYRLDRYIKDVELITQGSGELSNNFMNQLNSLKADIFSTTNEAILMGGLQPNMATILSDFKVIQAVVQQESNSDKNSPVYQKFQEIKNSYENIEEILVNEEFKKIVSKLPKSVTDTFDLLAKQTRTEVKQIDQEIEYFKDKVAGWFQASMDRSTGVYKRNAKGVAILIGILIAAIANADTFYIVGKLSKNDDLRQTITSTVVANVGKNNVNGIQPAATGNTDINLAVRDASKALGDNASLPIGWTNSNVCQQIGLIPASTSGDKFISSFDNLGTNCATFTGQSQRNSNRQGWTSILSRIPGWIISGFAIAMGAPFWFDLLGKVINVRNTGPKPVSSNENQPPSA